MLAMSCRRGEPVPTTESIFEGELRRRGVEFSVTEEGYKVATRSGDLLVSLENVGRDYKRDKDPTAVIQFVDMVLAPRELPPWQDSKTQLFFLATPSDYDFGATIHHAVSKEAAKVLVLTDLQEGRISWVAASDLAAWNVTREQAEGAAESNLARLVDGKRLVVDEIDGAKVGLVPIESRFKSSIIFAPNFKAFVTQDLEWPILAVIPCRDFVYLFAEKDRHLIDGIGSIIQREYRESAYPITTEVLKISDHGIQAIGAFAK
jgi:hypothetical protein